MVENGVGVWAYIYTCNKLVGHLACVETEVGENHVIEPNRQARSLSPAQTKKKGTQESNKTYGSGGDVLELLPTCNQLVAYTEEEE